MPADWSRRAALVSLASAIAGCTTGPETPATDEPTDAPDGSPTEGPPPTASGEVEHLPADDPALAWAVRLPEPISNPPAVDFEGDRVYVGTGEERVGTPTTGGQATAGAVFGLRATDGGEEWRAATDAPVVEPPVVHDGRVHAVVGYSTGLAGVDQRLLAYGRDGERRWATDPARGFLSIVAADGGTVFAGTSDDAIGTDGETLFAFGSGGDVRWKREAGDAMGATVADGQLLYSAGSQAFVSYDLADGAKGGRPPANRWGTRRSESWRSRGSVSPSRTRRRRRATHSSPTRRPTGPSGGATRRHPRAV